MSNSKLTPGEWYAPEGTHPYIQEIRTTEGGELIAYVFRNPPKDSEGNIQAIANVKVLINALQLIVSGASMSPKGTAREALEQIGMIDV